MWVVRGAPYRRYHHPQGYDFYDPDYGGPGRGPGPGRQGPLRTPPYTGYDFGWVRMPHRDWRRGRTVPWRPRGKFWTFDMVKWKWFYDFDREHISNIYDYVRSHPGTYRHAYNPYVVRRRYPGLNVKRADGLSLDPRYRRMYYGQNRDD